MNKQVYTEIRQQLDFEPKAARLIAHLAQDFLLLAAITALLASEQLWAYALSQPLLAALFFRSFGILHEAVHGNLSENRRVNDWLGVFYGALCFLPFTTWRSLHQEHHAWVGNFEKDPVMRMVREFPKKSEMHKTADTYFWRSWIPYIAFLQEAVFWTGSAKLIVEKDSYQGKKGELFASVGAPLLVASALLLGGFAIGNAFALAPAVIIYLMMVEVINLPHHLRLPRLPAASEEKLSLWQQYKVSRTCIYTGWFSRLVLLNFNYHAEHHMFPTLPWHELPKAYERVRAANPQGYQFCEGHDWIRVNRQKDLREVFSPTEILASEKESKPKAA